MVDIGNIADKALGELARLQHGYANERLLFAVKHGNPAAVLGALNAGADPNARDMKGRPALQVALERNRFQTADLLVVAGAEVNFPFVGGYHRQTPLSRAMHSLHMKEARSFIERLLSIGADINYHRGIEAENPTILFDLSRRLYETDLTKECLRRGADITVRNKDGKYADETIDLKHSNIRLPQYYLLLTERKCRGYSLPEQPNSQQLVQRNEDGYAPLDYWRVWEDLPRIIAEMHEAGEVFPVQEMFEKMPDGRMTRLEAAHLVQPDVLQAVYSSVVWKNRTVSELTRFHQSLPAELRAGVKNFHQLRQFVERQSASRNGQKGRT